MQQQKGKSIDWNKRLALAKRLKPFGLDLLLYPRNKKQSLHWVTCACGNQCSIIPRYENGAPRDFELSNLGSNFYINVSERNYEQAEKTLAKIEIRSSELIKRELRRNGQ